MCVSPLLYSLYTHDCKPGHDSNIIIKFADDTTLIGLVSDDDDSAYDVKHVIKWCASKDLVLNVSKTKEIVVDFRKSKYVTSTLRPTVNNSEVEIVDSFTLLDIHITSNVHGQCIVGACVRKLNNVYIFCAASRNFI